jgi:hypothetical protein
MREMKIRKVSLICGMFILGSTAISSTVIVVTSCKDGKVDLSNEYRIDEPFGSKPSKLKIFEYVKGEDTRVANKGIEDFD